MKQCIFGGHLKHGDVFIEKVPEGVVMCLDCSDKNRDDTKYDGASGSGRRLGQYGVGYLEGHVDTRGPGYTGY